MYLSEFTEDCSLKPSVQPNLILQIFLAKIDGIYTVEQCVALGLQIREEWEERNNIYKSDADMKGLELSMERLQGECLKIRTENRDMISQIAVLKDEAKKTNAHLTGIVSSIY